MNTVENIIEKINAETEARVSAILAEANEKAQAILAEKAAKAAAEAEKMLDAARADGAAVQKRILSGAQQKCRANELAAKRQLVSMAFDKAYADLCAQSDKDMVETMALLAAPEIKGDEELLVAEKLSHLCESLAAAVKEKNPAFTGKCSVSARVSDVGVVIKNGDVEINKTFGALIREKKEALEEAVVNIIF